MSVSASLNVDSTTTKKSGLERKKEKLQKPRLQQRLYQVPGRIKSGLLGSAKCPLRTTLQRAARHAHSKHTARSAARSHETADNIECFGVSAVIPGFQKGNNRVTQKIVRLKRLQLSKKINKYNGYLPRFKSANDKSVPDLTPLQLETLFGDKITWI